MSRALTPVDASLLERVSGRPLDELRGSGVRLARALAGVCALQGDDDVLLDPATLALGPDGVAAVVAPLSAGAPDVRLRVIVDAEDVEALRIVLDAGVRSVALRRDPAPAVRNLLSFFRCDVAQISSCPP
jgi:hypothetical protein